MTDKLILGGHEFTSRFILGSGKYSLDLINAAVQNAGAEIITLALRRANQGGTANILDYIPEGVTLLPNTSGARTADEAHPHCPSVARVRLRRFREDRDHARQQVPAPGQSGDHPRDRDPREGGLCRHAVYVSRSVRGARLVNAGAACSAARGSDRHEQGSRNARFHQGPHRRDRSSDHR